MEKHNLLRTCSLILIFIFLVVISGIFFQKIFINKAFFLTSNPTAFNQQPESQFKKESKKNYSSGEVLIKLEPGKYLKTKNKNISLDKSEVSIDDLDEDQPLVGLLRKQSVKKVAKVFKHLDKPEKELGKIKQKYPERKINKEEFIKYDWSNFYKLSYGGGTDPKTMAKIISSQKEVLYAEPNFFLNSLQADLPDYKIFLTSTKHNADFGGLNGADAYCQSRADAANLSGTYIAWLSTSTTNAADRIPDAAYYQTNGNIVAASKFDLLDGEVNEKLMYDEFGNQLPILTSTQIYTATRNDGLLVGTQYTCGDWTRSDIYSPYAAVGFASNKNYWSWYPASARKCSDPAYIYCIQIQEGDNNFLPDDEHFSYQWSFHNEGQTGGSQDADIDLPEAWQINQGSTNTIVAVIDSGIDYNHPDLGECFGSGCKVVDGYDFANSDSDPMDVDGHGTHVAGIIAASTNNKRGVAGICPNCSLMALKFFQDGSGGYAEDALSSIEYAVNHGARVLSNSYGGLDYSQIFQDMINWAVSQNVVFVAAAGNNGRDLIYYPANYDNVLSVAATNKYDQKTGYSNFGIKIDVSAPGGYGDTSCVNPMTCCRYPIGEAIFSTISNGTSWNEWGQKCGLVGLDNEKYMGMAGTSMATPHVSGIAGLVISHNPQLEAPMVFGQVKYTADNIDSLNPSYIGKIGVGRVNALSALTNTAEPKLVYSKINIYDQTALWSNGLLEPGEEVDLGIVIQNEWQTTKNVQAILTSESQYLQVQQPNSDYGQIESGQSKENQPMFAVMLSPNTPAGQEISLNLHLIFDNNGLSQEIDLPLYYKVTDDMGWPKAESSWAVAIVDLDLDGINELITFSNREIKAYTYDGHFLWQFKLINGEYATKDLLVDDIDLDGWPEIVFISRKTFMDTSSSLYVLEHNGISKQNWPKTQPVKVYQPPSLADINNDGYKEIIVGTTNASFQPVLIAYQESGDLLWTYTGENETAGKPVIADIDNNGTLEIVVSFYSSFGPSNLVVLDALNGGYIHSLAEIGARQVINPPVLGDLDNDQDLEIVFISDRYSPSDSQLHIYHHTGEIMAGWPQTVGAERLQQGSLPVLADIDNDSDLEIFLNAKDITTDGNLLAWHHDASLISGWPVLEPKALHNTAVQPAVGDIDSDNQPEILFFGKDEPQDASANCYILAYNSDGTQVDGYPYLTSNTTCDITSINLVNFNTDNDLYLVVSHSGEGGLMVLKTSQFYNNDSLHWPVYLYNFNRENIYINNNGGGSNKPFNLSDLFQLLKNFGKKLVSSLDIDSSGKLNSLDFSHMVLGGIN